MIINFLITTVYLRENHSILHCGRACFEFKCFGRYTGHLLNPPLPLCVSLLLLFRFILGDVDTDGKLCHLCAILFLYLQSVFAQVNGCNSSDGDAGKLSVLKLQRVVIVR